MAKWLITGVAGFIGSNLMRRLVDDGEEVVGIDNFSNGRHENILEYKDDFKFIKGDIRDAELCKKLCVDVDYVLHQAALGSVPRSIDTPVDSNDSNVNGFLNLIVAAKDAGVKKFVYASSGSVYGDDTSLPKHEEITGDPLSPYAATKVINEVYAGVFSKVYGFDSVGLRYFNVYGRNQKFSGPYVTVIPTWSRAFILNEPIYIYGDGLTSRDFCFIDDVVDANILAAKSELVGSHVFNVGAGYNISLNELFKLIKEAFDNPNVEPIYRDFRAGDTRHTLADLTNIKDKMGYEPKENIYTGLIKAIEWYKETIDGERSDR